MPVANVPKKSLQVVSIEEFKNERLAEAVIFETFKMQVQEKNLSFPSYSFPSGIIESGDVLFRVKLNQKQVYRFSVNKQGEVEFGAATPKS